MKKHELGEHGAVCMVVQDGRVCVECGEFIPDKENHIASVRRKVESKLK